VEPGAHLHDGFFARSESGITFLWANVSGAGGPPLRSGVRGVGQGATLSAGGTPAPGLVLGGSLWTARIDPVFVEEGKVFRPDDDSVKLLMLRVGPLIDWYPHPARGFHAFATAGLTLQIETDTKGDPIEPLALGASFSTGAGRQWFVSNQLSLGLVARIAFGALEGARSGRVERTLFVAPELALSVTYH
jgi:hypothetical protein